ncbi:unnamed protein product [Somion occarium]|uniref:F-box domain-containing protein n=1 Tax=Somion occarium TaxID=3059160 RepID=A0ABP1E9B5_9APHY
MQDVDDLRLEVEEEIALHRQTVVHELRIIATKCRFLNNLLPVAKLLPEILAAIFMYFASDPLSYGLPGSTGPYSWIAITHVSHRWREVALGTPKLWSFIHLGTRDRVEEFLARSSQALLHIRPWDVRRADDIRIWGENARRILPSVSVASLRLVLAQSSRIQTLSLALSNNVIERAFSVFSSSAEEFYAPALETLKFTSTHGPSFPDILTKGILPKLTHVELRGYNIPWHSAFLRTNLRSLIIRHDVITSPPGSSLSIGDLLVALSHMPGLQLLEVVSEYCSRLCETGGSYGSLQSVDLPCLQTLQMCLDAASIDAFLSHCTFPLSTTIAFKTDVRHNHGWEPFAMMDGTHKDKFDALRSIIRKSVDIPGQTIPSTGLSIHFDSLQTEPDPLWPESPGVEQNRMTLRTYALDPSSGQQQVHGALPPPHFSIRFSYRQGWKTPVILQNLLLGLPLSNVVDINVGSSQGCRIYPIAREMASFIAELVGRCSPSGLDILRMSGPSIDILHFLMSQPTHDALDWRLKPGPTLGNRGLFGCLRSLMLSDMPKGGQSWNGFEGIHIENLCDSIRTVAQRYKWSCGPFFELILQRCMERRECVLELVDAFSELVCQEGRFTRNLPLIHYDHAIQFLPSPPLTPYPATPPLPPDDYADSDLDRWNLVNPDMPTAGDWVDHLRSGRVAFDFRGDSGVTIEQNVCLTISPLEQFL